jgi:3-oxoadipate enol-lactonase
VQGAENLGRCAGLRAVSRSSESEWKDVRFVTSGLDTVAESDRTVAPVLPLFAHEVQGAAGAPWITFVPGIGNDRSFWAAQAEALSDSFRVLQFDPWGHGDSPAPPVPCSFDDVVAGVVTLWDELGIARTHVVGLGFGGSVALALALGHPDRVDRAVACCCRPRQPDERRAFWRERQTRAAEIGIPAITDLTVNRWLSDEFRAANPGIDAQLRTAMNRTTLAGYQAYTGVFAEMDFADRLGAIARPVQLVAAEHDHGGGPVAAMEAMATAIPGARLSVIPGSGHICVAEAPDAVTAIIRTFLDPAAGRG